MASMFRFILILALALVAPAAEQANEWQIKPGWGVTRVEGNVQLLQQCRCAPKYVVAMATGQPRHRRWAFDRSSPHGRPSPPPPSAWDGAEEGFLMACGLPYRPCEQPVRFQSKEA